MDRKLIRKLHTPLRILRTVRNRMGWLVTLWHWLRPKLEWLLHKLSWLHPRRYISILDVCLINLRKSPLFTTVIPSKIFENAAMGIPMDLRQTAENTLHTSGGDVPVVCFHCCDILHLQIGW